VSVGANNNRNNYDNNGFTYFVIKKSVWEMNANDGHNSFEEETIMSKGCCWWWE
jgi:hypothetical protein